MTALPKNKGVLGFTGDTGLFSQLQPRFNSWPGNQDSTPSHRTAGPKKKVVPATVASLPGVPFMSSSMWGEGASSYHQPLASCHGPSTRLRESTASSSCPRLHSRWRDDRGAGRQGPLQAESTQAVTFKTDGGHRSEASEEIPETRTPWSLKEGRAGRGRWMRAATQGAGAKSWYSRRREVARGPPPQCGQASPGGGSAWPPCIRGMRLSL